MGRPATADNRAAKLGASKASTARLSASRSSTEIATSGDALLSARITPEFGDTWFIGVMWRSGAGSRIPQAAHERGFACTNPHSAYHFKTPETVTWGVT